MEFGIAFPSYVDAWRDCEAAEAAGFTHAWFYDTQLLCSDVYAVLALAAEHTRTMTLGTLVAIPSNRIAPVTASAIATINELPPARWATARSRSRRTRVAWRRAGRRSRRPRSNRGTRSPAASRTPRCSPP